MQKLQISRIHTNNHLLDRLPPALQGRLHALGQFVAWEQGHIIYEMGGPMNYIYFPRCGVASVLTIMQDGNAIEVANIGKEGLVGLPALLEADVSQHRVFAQIPGDALRLRANLLAEEMRRHDALRQLIQRYHVVYLQQNALAAACNGLHRVEQRCCRWLLMTHDRVESDEIALTHEFLAVMLGVRRSSVSEVLQPLQANGLIRYRRGRITVLDRPRLEAVACECYGRLVEDYQHLLK